MDPLEASREAQLEASRAPFMEHLVELRTRLWYAILGVIGAAVVCGLFYEQLYFFFTDPLYATLEKLQLDVELKFRTLTGAFMFHFKTAIIGGIFFGIPVVLYQVWQFVAPGLYNTERKMAFPFVVLSSACFIGGGLFAYYLVLPQAFEFLLDFNIEGARQLKPDLTIEDYLGFTTKLLLAFGIVFEMPVAIGFFAAIGLVTHRGLIQWWRWAIVVAFVLGAMLTPPDYITQTMLAIPLVSLYGVSIGIAYLITTRREAGEGGEPPDGGEVDEADEADEATAADPASAPPQPTDELGE